jgi:hypothetical protein
MAGGARLESATVASRQGGCPLAAGPHQHRHRLRRVGGRRRQQGELVVQVARVLDKTNDGSRRPVEGERAADADLEGCRHRLGDRDLAGGGRVAALLEPQHRRAVGAVRVLGPELEGLDRAWNRHRLVADHLGGAQPRPDRGDLRVQRGWIGPLEVEAMGGRAESGVGRRDDVVGGRDAEDRRGHGDGEQHQHQELLAPLSAEQPPSPAQDRSPSRNATVGRPLLGRPPEQR